MRKSTLPLLLQRALILLLILLSGRTYASHIVGADMYYTHVTGLTYKITVVLYGDCGPASAAAFASLPAGSPKVCVYNGGTLEPGMPLNLTIEPPSPGVEITPICPDSLPYTQCTNPTYTIPGIKRFVYSATYTLPTTSVVWRFVFNGQYGGSTAGRAAAITNITGTSTIQLIDTLNNLSVANNSNPTMTTVPTPFFCLNQPNSYNPGAVDPNGDFLNFTLVPAVDGTTVCSVGTSVTYTGIAWPGQPVTAATPLRCTAGSFIFDPLTGQISFFPNFLQRAVVVYNIREFRGGVFVGSCQREMTFLVRTCTNLPPSGIYNTATAGTITDSTHFEICSDAGAFSININPTDPEGQNIFVTSSGLPTGSTFTTTGNGTTAPHSTFSWTTTGTPVGSHVFYLTFKDDNCPENGTLTRAFTVTIKPAPTPIAGTLSICIGATSALSSAPAGGTWSSSLTGVATVSSSGAVSGVAAGTSTISYVMPNGCYTTAVVTVLPTSASPITGTTNICVGSTATFTHPIPGGTWSATGSAATVSATGVVTGVSPGTATISYTSTGTCLTGTTSLIVTVSAPLTVAPITGPSTVCETSTIALADATPGGTWSTTSSTASVSSIGVVTGISSGTALISYTVSNVCGPVSATKIITINPLPVAGTISGPTVLCAGDTMMLTTTGTGGIWTVTPITVATISPTGRVTGVGGGTATVSYTVTNSCGVAGAGWTITVNTLPTVAPITGPSTVCETATIALSCTTPGGTWTSGSANATVSSAGIVTGVTAGTATISYSVTNMCGTVTTTKVITINPAPAVSIITGPSSVCVGDTMTLSISATGGTWSSTATGIATIGTSGKVTGVTPGTTTISYTVTNSCGTIAATKVITVNPLPTVSAIVGLSSVCVASVITLTCSPTGGTWSTPGSAVSVSTTGDVTGLAYGTATVSYSVTNMCGTVVATKVISVDTLPIMGAITGPDSVCAGSTIALSATPAGGVWSSTATGVATVSAGGVATGVAAGTTTISYTITNSCGTVASSSVITVNPLPTVSVIVGSSSVCVGLTITLTCTPAGGVWSSVGTATVSPTGVVTGVSGGTATISYTITNSCGSITATKPVTVNLFPDAGTIAGPTEVCVGQTITLTDTVAGGTWSGGAPNASVSPTGVVTGISPGTATISYTVINGCGPATVTYIITINPTPDPGTISGPTNVCEGDTIVLTASVPGGSWTIAGTASINSSGSVTGIAPGTATVTYTVTLGPCADFTTYMVTVDPLPHVGPISGGPMVCTSNTILMTDAVPGGTWSCTANASIDSTTGVLTGLTPGTAIVTYRLTNGCGTDFTTKVVTVNLTPPPGTLSGPGNLCVGTFITITPSLTGGTWSSSAPGVASVTTGGTVGGLSPGTAIITYTRSTSVCSSFVIKPVIVDPLPNPGVISGGPKVCEGDSIMLTSSVAGGSWSIAGGSATISATGVLTGLSAGVANVSYTVTNSCGSASTTKVIVINPTPTVSIEGPALMCIGYPILFSASATPGSWSSTNTSAATVNGLGMVTPVSVGTAIISYSITNSDGCTGYSSHLINVGEAPDPGTISGPPHACVDGDIIIHTTNPGGTWSSGNNSVVTIDATTGAAHGVGAGTAYVTYTSAPNSFGCTGRATFYIEILTTSPVTIGGDVKDAKCAGSADGRIVAYPGGGTGPWQYLWNTNKTTASIEDLPLGTYHVDITDKGTGCTGAKDFVIREPAPLQVVPEVKNEECKMGNGSITLTVTGGSEPFLYKWSTNGTGSEITGLTPGSYAVEITDANSCQAKLSADVIEGPCDEVVVQTGLTPNGDGANDVWKITGLQNYPDNLVQLFDKWGDKVFEQKGYDGAWDGRGRNGAYLPDGTYFYIIKLNARNGAGGKNVLTGSMLIKR
ncbi:MAG: gliding motility-associated C-terminal domain-containing protein [Taibaiella sp.]|nr:gliding motility-associated C-terminal domain-containing protein [Taibaiella sp.]